MRHALRALTAASIFSLAACAQANPGSLDEKDVQEIVRSYLLENPEIIREALVELERKEAQAEIQQSRDLIAEFSDQILRDPRDYSVGPADADVQFVEFFDYNCGFCKRSTGIVESTIADYPDNVRVIFKEVPVLTGPDGTSHFAARAALASARQGKYQEMHFALMDQRGLTEERILDIAADVGLDVEQLQTDMQDPQISNQIEDNLRLASEIPAFTGTPFFIINDEYVSGANLPRVEALLEEALGS